VRPFTRGPSPAVLEGGREGWTQAWVQRRAANAAAIFAWPQHENEKLNAHLVRALSPLTQGHCAYCDNIELGSASRETIDHFLPKTTHPAEAFAWANLYLACDLCQQHKRDDHEEDLLRPDVPGFSFSRFFEYQPRSGRIEPNPAADPADRQRAAVTIRLLGFNEKARPESRQRILRIRRPDHALDDLSYRFLIELAP
jgi:uncharacterized protein (TIGR02646 family)